jgi:hypothetical protein
MKKKGKKTRDYEQAHLRTTKNEMEKRRWTLIIDYKEAAINFYSILLALQRSNGGGLINEEALMYVTKWMNFISVHIPEVKTLVDDSCGLFRKRDMSSLNITLELNYKERTLMHFIWKTMCSRLIAPEIRDDWIKNQGIEDYEAAIKNYKTWISSLEGSGYLHETVQGEDE